MYEFTHGIDHIGRNGFAPILVIGKNVCEQDFITRDLSDIQGIHISHRGLDDGVQWHDINVELLGKKFPQLRYLHIEFGSSCDVSDFGDQPLVEHLTLICPKLKQKHVRPQFQKAQIIELQIPTEYFADLISNRVEELTLYRPKISTLNELPPRQTLRKLKVVLARNLKNLQGIENLSNLASATFSDCPNLVEIGNQYEKSCIREMSLFGCKKLRSIEGLAQAQSLEKSVVIGGPKELVVPDEIIPIFKNRT